MYTSNGLTSIDAGRWNLLHKVFRARYGRRKKKTNWKALFKLLKDSPKFANFILTFIREKVQRERKEESNLNIQDVINYLFDCSNQKNHFIWVQTFSISVKLMFIQFMCKRIDYNLFMLIASYFIDDWLPCYSYRFFSLWLIQFILASNGFPEYNLMASGCG